MKTHPTETSAIAISAQAKVDEIKNNAFFRCGAFITSTAVGYFFSYWVITGLRLLPAVTGGSHNNGNALLDILHTLHSGFGG